MDFGHIILSNNKKGIMPRLIRFFTKSKFSHSLIMAPPILGVPMIIEAARRDVSFKRFDTGYIQNPNEEFVIYKLNVPTDVKADALRQVLETLQVEYGILELPWFAYRAILELFGKDIKSQDNWSQHGIICSELCVMYLTYCGLGDLFKDYGKGSVHAEDLRKIMDANPKLFTPIEPKEYMYEVRA